MRLLASTLCPTVCALVVTASCAHAKCPVPAETGYEAAARAQFSCSSSRPLDDPSGAEREFVARYEFPQTAPPAQNLPWQGIDFKTQPEAYLRALLAYGLKDNAEVDFRLEDNNKSVWCHAPWFHNSRERLHGMTNERGSRVRELHSLQEFSARNVAVGIYNDIGCYALGTLWKDPAFPKTKGFTFPEGSYSIKLLFTNASTREVPYLTGSKVWNAATGARGAIEAFRLLQVDVAVRDSAADQYTGWLFGTFIYDAYAPGETVWEKLVPVGLMWGNDPTLTTGLFEQRGAVPKQGWFNEAVAQKFYHLPRHHLGLHGRVNGPVDNPRASCLGCHGRALDWGRAIPPDEKDPVHQEANLLLPFAPNPTDDNAVKLYFRNLKPDQPYIENTQSLDFSLQAAGGIARFRSWVAEKFPDQEGTSDVPAYIFEAERDGATPEASLFTLKLRQAAGAPPSTAPGAPFTRGEE